MLNFNCNEYLLSIEPLTNKDYYLELEEDIDYVLYHIEKSLWKKTDFNIIIEFQNKTFEKILKNDRYIDEEDMINSNEFQIIIKEGIEFFNRSSY
jgi:hypothetical protein